MPTEKLLSRKCRGVGSNRSRQHGIRTARCGLRQTVRLFARDGSEVGTFDHPNTVGGLAFHPKGRRLAAAHYGGASLGGRRPGSQKPRSLAWAGSHLSLTWSDGKYIVTATQENDLHGWRSPTVPTCGCPAIRESEVDELAARGRHLATSGAEPVVCCRFTEKADRWARRQPNSAVA